MRNRKHWVIEGSEDNGTLKCGCSFCQCKCPVCGTMEIEVDFRPEWQLSNDLEDHVRVDRMGEFIRIECPECGELEGGYKSYNESKADLEPLIELFDELLQLPDFVSMKYNENGTITVSRG